MKLLWISDFFNDFGGAEKVDNIIINYLTENSIIVDKIESHLCTKENIKNYSVIFISNFVNLSEENIKYLASSYRGNYFIYEHDHKYLSTRDPSMFPNYYAFLKDIKNKYFYVNARNVFVQCKKHAEIMYKNLLIENIYNLGTSFWSDNEFNIIEKNLNNNKKYENGIYNSQNSIKGTQRAKDFCKKENLSYYLIEHSPYEKFIKNLSQCERFIFFPKIFESFSRVLTESKMLGLKIKTNEKSGVIYEEWFEKKSGKELIEYLKNKNKENLNLIKEQLNIVFNCCNKDLVIKLNNLGQSLLTNFSYDPGKILVSIITSVHNGKKYIKSFLENICNQSCFSRCKLILVKKEDDKENNEILKQYSNLYPENIKIINVKEDNGVYDFWNIGIKESESEFITNANLDDRRFQLDIEEKVRYLLAHKDIDLVYGDIYITSDENKILTNDFSNLSNTLNCLDFSLPNMIKCPPGPMPMWRRKLHEENDYFNEKYKSAGDWEFWLRCIRDNGAKFAKIPGIFGVYYNNPNGLSTNLKTKSNKFLEEKEIFNNYKEIFGNNYKFYSPYFNGDNN